MNSAHALGSRALSCSSTDFKLKTLQPLGSDETEDWIRLTRLPLLLTTSLQIFADQPT